LDRCEHGRHSIDSCFDCPGGQSHGNPFLFTEIPPNNAFPENVRYEGGRVEVRIGTMVRGEPIWVVVRDRPRSGDGSSVFEQMGGTIINPRGSYDNGN
jgi:hypothetical protein